MYVKAKFRNYIYLPSCQELDEKVGAINISVC